MTFSGDCSRYLLLIWKLPTCLEQIRDGDESSRQLMRQALGSHVCGYLLIEVDERRSEWRIVIVLIPRSFRIPLQLSPILLESRAGLCDLLTCPINRIHFFPYPQETLVDRCAGWLQSDCGTL